MCRRRLPSSTVGWLRLRGREDEMLADVLGPGEHEIGQLHDERVVAGAAELIARRFRLLELRP